jgi:hypothetical protein
VIAAPVQRHNRQVALKVLKRDLAEGLGAQRFLKEIEVTTNLQRPHILSLYDERSAEPHDEDRLD